MFDLLNSFWDSTETFWAIAGMLLSVDFVYRLWSKEQDRKYREKKAQEIANQYFKE